MALFKRHQSWIRAIVAVWCVYTITLIALFIWSHLDTDSGAEGHGSSYVRLSHDNNGVIIFVHGVVGDAISTWTNPDTKAYWPDLLTKDPKFDHYDIFVYEFPSTPVGTSLEIDELADDMKRVLENAEVLGQKELIFLSHSMGGLVTRALLLKYRELIPKVGFIYFFLHQRQVASWQSLES
jgi:pimeloyl-ACP methyl ester carboxylesterase